jgi:hypothetical protein
MQASPQAVAVPAFIVPKPRLEWVDLLRSAMIILVVNMHACCTYTHVGGWYVSEGADPGLAAKIPWFFYQGHLQAFFMGLLFFLVGHFAQLSLVKKGTAAFLRERLFRLGLPALLYMLVIQPLIVIGINPYGIPAQDRLPWLGRYLLRGDFLGGSGPLWFVLAALLFCVALAAVHGLRSSVASAPAPAPGLGAITLLGILMVLGSFLVRTAYPIGTNVLNFQLCFFTQYILVFAAGVASARQGWLAELAAAPRTRWLGLAGLVLGPLALLVTLKFWPPEGEKPAILGGWNGGAFGLAAWEQLTGLCIGLGCLALFSRIRFRNTGPVRLLNDNAFGIYVLHAPVMVALSQSLQPWQPGTFAKVLTLTVATLLASLLASILFRRLPGLGRIL